MSHQRWAAAGHCGSCHRDDDNEPDDRCCRYLDHAEARIQELEALVTARYNQGYVDGFKQATRASLKGIDH